MEALFSGLSSYLYGSMWLAFFAAFAWGILSIVLSPCHLTGIPLIIAYVSDSRDSGKKKAFTASLAFSIGILVTLGIIGVVTGFLGRIIGNTGRWGRYVVAVLFVFFGLYLIGVLPQRMLSFSVQPKIRSKGTLSALFLGLVFGLALGPCSFAFMAPMLGIAFQTASSNLSFAIGLFVCYSIGHCGVIVLAGTLMGVVKGILKWNETAKGMSIFKKICGGLLILAAAYLAVF